VPLPRRVRRKLDQYRKALDSGADPAVAAKWISDVQLERSAAERVLAAQRAAQPITPDEIRAMIDAAEDKVRMLTDADPSTEAALYASFGLTLTYEHEHRVVRVEALPTALGTNERVGGTTHSLSTCAPWEAWLTAA
jgi:site-specific DNA recombinase